MPIVFIHGVAVRDGPPTDVARRLGQVPWPVIEDHLRRYIAPAISSEPQSVPIEWMYWGDLGATLAWDGRFAIAGLDENLTEEEVDLRTLDPEELGAVVERAVLRRTGSTASWPDLIEAVWEVARDSATTAHLATSGSAEEAEAFLAAAIQACYERRSGLIGDDQERGSWWHSLGRQVRPTADRALARRRANVIAVTNRLRRPWEAYVPIFMGDLINYLNQRGDASAPGPIPERTLQTLSRASEQQRTRPGEPLIVLTHSMGGQIMYDVITHFLPRMDRYRDVRIDFWCATASQIGLFEELKLFLESSPDYGGSGEPLVPAPPSSHLGYWWNVWDHTDLLSFSARGIIDGVDDSAFFLGPAIQHNHSAYLNSADFYRTLAAKIRVHTGEVE